MSCRSQAAAEKAPKLSPEEMRKLRQERDPNFKRPQAAAAAEKQPQGSAADADAAAMPPPPSRMPPKRKKGLGFQVHFSLLPQQSAHEKPGFRVPRAVGTRLASAECWQRYIHLQMSWSMLRRERCSGIGLGLSFPAALVIVCGNGQCAGAGRSETAEGRECQWRHSTACIRWAAGKRKPADGCGFCICRRPRCQHNQ